MKKGLSLFLSVLMVLSILTSMPLTVSAASVDDLTFELNEDGKSYSVTGCSEEVSGELVIPDTYNGLPVTCIGDYVFSGCYNITMFTIGNEVTSIGDFAFENCDRLTSIVIPDRVTNIGNYAFAWCESLASIIISNSVTSIGKGTFDGCEGLISVTIPDSVTNIGVSAFEGCTSLVSITIPDSVTNIEWDAFNNTGYYNDSDNWENGFLYIDNHLVAADETLNGEYIIKEGTKTIAEYVFTSCESLTSVTTPDSLISIGNDAFYGCTNLSTVSIGAGVINIGDRAFEYTDLENVYYSDDESAWNDIVVGADNSTLSQALIHYEVDNVETHWVEDNSKLICTGYINYICPCGYEYSVYAQDGTGHNYVNGTCSVCGESALVFSLNNDGESYFVEFCDSSVSGSVVIPDTYNGLPVTSIGYCAFDNCTALTSITIPDSVESIGANAFYYCKSLSSITIPDSVTSIGDRAFGCCESLTSITISDSVTSVGIGAFECCISLTSIIIPSNVTSIGRWAFGYDFGLDSGVFDYIKIDNFIIYGTKGSAAETYANDNGFKFVDVNHTHTSSSWITDKKATVNRAGSKHKECTECGEILETATIKQLKCEKPSLKKIENTADGVKITWAKENGADKYYVYRKTGSSGKYSKIATVKGNSKVTYTDKSAKSGKKYYYYVKAVNEAGSSSASNSKSIYYLADTTLSTPKSTKSGITLKWKKVTGAEGYKVYRKTGSGSYEKIVTVKGNTKVTYTDKKAKKGKTYTYKIRAYKSKTYSAYSNAKKIKDKY